MSETARDVLLTFEGALAFITLNRPQSGNALSRATMGALRGVADRLAQRADIRAIVLQGAGPLFCVGGDIREFQQLLPLGRAAMEPLIGDFHHFVRTLRGHKAPVIAAVQGAAAGAGLSLMLGADFALAAEGTKFRLAYRQIATSPDGGGSFFLALRAGHRRAAELMLVRDVIEADEAEALGLVNAVVPPDRLASEARALAGTILANAPHAAAAAKALLTAQIAPALDAHLNLEAEYFLSCGETADFAEGVGAFLEKRPPRFSQ